MRFMIIGKATKETEAGVLPKPEAFAAMQQYHEELVSSGVLLAAEGLAATSKGALVKFSGDQRTVIDGSFAESKEVIAGFTIIQVNSLEEAIEWVKRAPMEEGAEIEIRQVFEAEDFGAKLTPELREQEERLRQQTGKH